MRALAKLSKIVVWLSTFHVIDIELWRIVWKMQELSEPELIGTFVNQASVTVNRFVQ